MTLPEAITAVLPPDGQMRIGTITSVDPVMVNVQGTNVPAGIVSSYTPVLNDTVAVLRQDATWLILGRTVPPEPLGAGGTVQSQAGSADLTVAATTSATLVQAFARPFTNVPSVATNISTGAGAVSGWGSRAINITTTGFTIFIFGASSSFTANVQWQAQEMTQ